MIERVMLDLNRSEGIIGSAILDLNKGEVAVSYTHLTLPTN